MKETSRAKCNGCRLGSCWVTMIEIFANNMSSRCLMVTGNH